MIQRLKRKMKTNTFGTDIINALFDLVYNTKMEDM
jgi:hypothetical protein